MSRIGFVLACFAAAVLFAESAAASKRQCVLEVQRTTSSRKIEGCTILARRGTRLILACPCR